MTIAFAKCSNEKFAELQIPSLGSRFQKLLGKLAFPGIIFVIFAATIVGLIDIVIGLGRLLIWIVGKV